MPFGVQNQKLPVWLLKLPESFFLREAQRKATVCSMMSFLAKAGDGNDTDIH